MATRTETECFCSVVIINTYPAINHVLIELPEELCGSNNKFMQVDHFDASKIENPEKFGINKELKTFIRELYFNIDNVDSLTKLKFKVHCYENKTVKKISRS